MSWLLDVPIAHRGLHGPGAPELSPAALRRAINAGVAVEIDVRMCRDDIIVIHDEDTARVTGVRLVVAHSTRVDLQALTVYDSPEPLPTLDEVLAVIDGRVPLLIEVKPGIPATTIGPAVLASLAGYEGAWAVQSFDPRILRWFQRCAPRTLRGQLSGDLSQEGLSYYRRFMLETMVANVVTRPDFIAWDVDALPSLILSFWRTILRCPVLAWTVQTVGQLDKARAARCGVIFENVDPLSGGDGQRPDTAHGHLGGAGVAPRPAAVRSLPLLSRKPRRPPRPGRNRR